MDAYIAISGSHNVSELADVPIDRMKLVAKKLRPLQDQRVQKTKWVVLRWPTPAMAQLANMSTEAFEDFFFKVCTLDYRKLQPGMKALKALMEKTDAVQIKGPGTDLRFSIKGIPAIICGGDRNIPDGEVFSCPVKDSVEGHVTFNAPSIYQSTPFDNIRLDFRDGKVVEATSKAALARGMQGLASGLARRVNHALGRRGSLFADRYHAHALSSPREVRNAIVYVLRNYVKHREELPDLGTEPRSGIDPCSSARWFGGWAEAVRPPPIPPPVTVPATWLLRAGWKRLGLIRREERPSPRPASVARPERRPGVPPSTPGEARE
jgi:hypothetical protein